MPRVSTLSKLVVLTLSVLLVAGDWCGAQERGRRGRRGFGRGIDKTDLLGAEQVQKELKLAEDQKSQVEEALDEYRRKRRELFSGLRDLSREERREKFAEIRTQGRKLTEKTQKKLNAILEDEQHKRLDEIVLQVRGPSALRNPEVAEKLGLTEEQRGEVRDLLMAQRQMRRELFQGLRDVPREERREKFSEIRDKMGKLQDETEKSLLGVLTEEQKQQWKQMQGAEFDLDRRELFRGFGRRGRD